MLIDAEIVYQIEDFRFTYPESNQAISWSGEHTIRRGERILLTGSSGSGKSTLLYGLMGLIPETVYGKVSGEIKYLGKSILENPEKIRGKAGLILQNPAAQMLCRSVREELAYGLENLGKPVKEILEQIEEWSLRFEVEKLLDRETMSLSGGEKQKITLLSILLTRPEILMLDEPTAFLDPQSAREIMTIIQNYQKDKTLIFVEHNLGFVSKLITRNLHLRKDGAVLDQAASEVDWQTHLPHLQEKVPGKRLMSLSEIRFSYGKEPILNGINLEIHAEEIIAIQGRNGSGKTTLLKIVAGLKRDFTGKILLEDKQLNNININKLREFTGLLFQNPENHFLFNSVEQELKNNKIKYLEEEFASKLQQSPFTLSEGEKRRLSTAIAYNDEKKILLLDEPTFGQDKDNKLRLIELLGKLRDEGLGIVIVSHDMEFTSAVSNRIFELKAGKLEEHTA